jgi:hypothetical protein
MKKLTLNPDTLTVETFESTAVSEQRGTVEGREFFATQQITCAVTLCRTGCVTYPCVCL